MNFRWFRTLFLLLVLLLSAGVVWAATATTEQEPNNTPAQANALDKRSTMEGAVSPAGDVDYFKIDGVNDMWGVVAFLDTGASSSSQQGVVTMYAPDGVTPLQHDQAAPGRKGVIAWQHFANGNPHFLRVNEAGDNQTISQYTLRYYALGIGSPGAEEGEQEPNNSPATANTSSSTNRGVIDSASDQDCYAMDLKKGEKLLIVLNADPEGDGGADYKLTLYKPGGAVWQRADRAGSGGNEYIDELVIPADGVYAYCVGVKSGAGASATYLAGPIVDWSDYSPTVQPHLSWDNPRPGNFARVGDVMHYTFSFTYTSALFIPKEFRMYVYYEEQCQDVVDAGNPDYQYGGTFGWQYDGLQPNTAITKTFTLRAKAPCHDSVTSIVALEYYNTGWGRYAYYTIGDGYYLPLVMR